LASTSRFEAGPRAPSRAFPDSELTAAGATVSADAVKDADIVIKVKRPGNPLS